MVSLPSGAQLRSAATDRLGWIVAATPNATTRTLARRFGARALRLPGAYTVPTGSARAFADALSTAGALSYAERNAPSTRNASFDPFTDRWARAAVVSPSQPLPAGQQTIGVIDAFVSPTHPDLAGHVRYINTDASSTITDTHATMVASVIAGAANGSGVTGILPGAMIASYGVPEQFGCAESADGILALANAGVKFINASYGSASACFAEYAAISMAYGEGTLLIASSGNDGVRGDRYPASWPHVMSVAANDIHDQTASFSNANSAVDVSAPGVDIPVAVAEGFDTEDGSNDGVSVVSGTSFSAPMVAGAAGWLGLARPGIGPGQIADMLRRSAIDLGPAGYDGDFGYGKVNIDQALQQPIPRADPLEPNDQFADVDGTVFGTPDPTVWRGISPFTLSASVDSIEDPYDVYRLRVPGRTSFKILMKSNGAGDADLAVYDKRATSFNQRSRVIDRSQKYAGQVDVVHMRNNSPAASTAYVVVYVPNEAKYADASYRLSFSRERRRR